MGAPQLDVIVRVSGVTLLLLLALMLMRDARSRRLAVWFAPFALCLSGFLISNTPDLSLRLHGFAGAATHLLSAYTVVFLWWFCLASFDPAFQPRGPVLGAGVAWFIIASTDRRLLGPALADMGLSWVLIAIGFGMIAHLAWRLIRDRAGDLVEMRRDARVMVVILLAGLLFIELCKEVFFGFELRPRAYTIAENAAFMAVTVWLSARLLRTDTSPFSSESRVAVGPFAAMQARETEEIEGEARLTERLRTLIEVEQAHLDPEMTFDAFVQRMGAPERVVRQLINQRLGYDHFRAFLNAYRMVEARRLLADPNQAGAKLISVALDSGFASLASFNRVFRASEGCAPSEYRNAQRSAGEPTRSVSRLNPAFEERSAGF